MHDETQNKVLSCGKVDQVHLDAKWVVVTFYTYCGKWKESIIRHQDTYRRGNYRARIARDRIGQGPGGFAL